MVSSHGVLHVCPEALTSAPGGSDSNRNAAVGGDDLRKSRLGIAEHAATVKPHATTARTLLMTPSYRHACMVSLPHYSVTDPANPKFPHGCKPKVQPKYGSSMVRVNTSYRG
jgi:hypothetical protein